MRKLGGKVERYHILILVSSVNHIRSATRDMRKSEGSYMEERNGRGLC